MLDMRYCPGDADFAKGWAECERCASSSSDEGPLLSREFNTTHHTKLGCRVQFNRLRVHNRVRCERRRLRLPRRVFQLPKSLLFFRNKAGQGPARSRHQTVVRPAREHQDKSILHTPTLHFRAGTVRSRAQASREARRVMDARLIVPRKRNRGDIEHYTRSAPV